MRAPTVPRAAPGWFLDRPVGLKIGTALGTLAVVAVGLTGLAADRIGQLRDAEQVLYSDTVLPLTELSEIQRSFQGDRARVIQYGIADVATREELRTELAERRIEIQALIDAYRPRAVDEAAFGEFEEQLAAYYALAEAAAVPARGRRRPAGLRRRSSRSRSGRRRRPWSSRCRPENVAQSELAADARGRRPRGRRSRRARRAVERPRPSASSPPRRWPSGWSAGSSRTVRSVQRSLEGMAAGDLTVAPDARRPGRARPDGGGARRGAQATLREVIVVRRRLRRRGRGLVGGAVGVVGADRGVGAGDQRAGRRRRRRGRGGVAQRADRRRRRRGDGRVDPGDRAERERGRPGRRGGGGRGGDDDGDGGQAGRVVARRSATSSR